MRDGRMQVAWRLAMYLLLIGLWVLVSWKISGWLQVLAGFGDVVRWLLLPCVLVLGLPLLAMLTGMLFYGGLLLLLLVGGLGAFCDTLAGSRPRRD